MKPNILLWNPRFLLRAAWVLGVSLVIQAKKVDFGDRPEIFIIGSAKSGTSSLNYVLQHHPDICRTVIKEPHFFDKDKRFLFNKQYYLDFFNVKQEGSKANCKYYVDATPTYIRLQNVPDRINQSFTPSQLAAKKFILILRDPVLRECSWYYHMVNFCVQEVAERLKTSQSQNPKVLCHGEHGNSQQYGASHCGLLGCEARVLNVTVETVRQVVDPFEAYVRGPNFDRTASLYDRQIENWLKYISRSQLFVVNMADLLRNHDAVITSLFSFLNISSVALDDLPHENGHDDYVCGCDGLKEIHNRLSKANTSANTLRIINQPGMPPQEPLFSPFEEKAFLDTRHCK
jgi:hypothetical protein